MNDNNYNTNQKRKYNTILLENPELAELLTDLVVFTQKWNTPRLAEIIDVPRQTLQARANKITKKEVQNAK